MAFFYAGVQGLLWQLVDRDFIKVIRKVDHSTDEMFWGNPDGRRVTTAGYTQTSRKAVSSLLM